MFLRNDRKATVTQITTCYIRGLQKSILERTTHPSLHFTWCDEAELLTEYKSRSMNHFRNNLKVSAKYRGYS